jgi:N-carbamoylputrescine amidase
MPFSSWFARSKPFDQDVWDASVEAHERWLDSLEELNPAIVLGSKPEIQSARRLNRGFIWDKQQGYRPVHTKYYLPDEEGFWEASWYMRGEKEFITFEVQGVRIGFLICTDLWFFEHARAYGKEGVHILACPRATPRSTLDKWLAGGRTSSIVSGAYCLSSNRFEPGESGLDMGGMGWITSPDGEVLGTTSRSEPFKTVQLDIDRAEKAKSTYPRYVKE